MPMPSSLPYPILCPDKPDLVQTIRTNADDRAAWCCSYYITGDPDHIDADLIPTMYSGSSNYIIMMASDRDRDADKESFYLNLFLFR